MDDVWTYVVFVLVVGGFCLLGMTATYDDWFNHEYRRWQHLEPGKPVRKGGDVIMEWLFFIVGVLVGMVFAAATGFSF